MFWAGFEALLTTFSGVFSGIFKGVFCIFWGLFGRVVNVGLWRLLGTFWGGIALLWVFRHVLGSLFTVFLQFWGCLGAFLVRFGGTFESVFGVLRC